MKKIFMMLPLMVALIALVGCKKTTDDPVEGENLKEDSPYYNQFNIANYGIFGEEPELIPGTQTTLNFSVGEMAVQLAYFDFYAWDGNLSYNENSGQFTGKGLLIGGLVPLYMIVEQGEYYGRYVNPTTGYFCVKTSSSATEGVMAPGVIDPATYGDWIDYCCFTLEDMPDVEKILKNTNGTLFGEYDVPQDINEIDGLIYRGAISRMVIQISDEGAVTAWGADVNWSNMTGDQRAYGFHFDPVTETITKPYNYRSVNRKFHEDVLNAPQQAPAFNADFVIDVKQLRKARPAIRK